MGLLNDPWMATVPVGLQITENRSPSSKSDGAGGGDDDGRWR